MSVLDALGRMAPELRAILGSVAKRARVYDIPTSRGLDAWMTVNKSPLASLAKDLGVPKALLKGKDMPKVHDVEWRGSAQSDDPQARARYGLEAMRGVRDGIGYDMRTYAPKLYHFFGASDAHDKLYASLLPQFEEGGYVPLSLKPTEEASHVFLARHDVSPMMEALLRGAGLMP